jgi:hypothetical protein
MDTSRRLARNLAALSLLLSSCTTGERNNLDSLQTERGSASILEGSAPSLAPQGDYMARAERHADGTVSNVEVIPMTEWPRSSTAFDPPEPKPPAPETQPAARVSPGLERILAKAAPLDIIGILVTCKRTSRYPQLPPLDRTQGRESDLNQTILAERRRTMDQVAQMRFAERAEVRKRLIDLGATIASETAFGNVIAARITRSGIEELLKVPDVQGFTRGRSTLAFAAHTTTSH